MQLLLYQYNGDNIVLDKSSRLTLLAEFTGDLKEASSLINPSILVVDGMQYDVTINQLGYNYDVVIDDENDTDVNVSLSNYISTANYAYIPEFNRYYFISNITSVYNDLWRIDMHVDVLMSYKDKIKELYAFVTRNEYEYNNMVRDDMVSFYYDKAIYEYVPQKGDKVNTTFISTRPLGTFTNYVLSVINDQIWSTGESVTPPDSSLPTVDNEISGQGSTNATYCATSLNVTRLARLLIDSQFSTLYSFVTSVIAFPFNISNDGDAVVLKLGTTSMSDGLTQVQCYKMTPRISKYYVIADFKISASSFLDYEPYTQYQIWIPYLSWVNVNADDILNNRIIVYYTINYQTGSAQVTIYDVTNSKIIFTSSCQVGVKIGLSSTNAREVKDAENSNNIGLGINLLTSALAVVGGIASSNPIAVGGGLISGGSAVAKFVQNQNTNYSRASGQLSSPVGGVYLSQDVKVRKTSMKLKNYTSDYAKLFGKPLNAYRKLGTLSGFTTIGEIHIENIESITSTEYDELYAILKSGFIL